MLRASAFASILLVFSLSAGAQTATQQAAPPAGKKELRNPDVVFVPTPEKVVDAMLNVAKAGKGDVLYDLGSGDGRIPIAAAKKFGVERATGIDIDPQRIKEANANLAKSGVGKRVKFVNEIGRAHV